MGFQQDVEQVLKNAPPQRQVLLFSATFPDWVRQISQRYTKDAKYIDAHGAAGLGVRVPLSVGSHGVLFRLGRRCHADAHLAQGHVLREGHERPHRAAG
jgi:hypothetical protein